VGFCIIVSGKCAMTRETPLSRDGIKLAELSVGDTFGEEALIAEGGAAPRPPTSWWSAASTAMCCAAG
jgi:hypothetical protein